MAAKFDVEQMAREQGLIWVSEAMIEYKHAREWFMSRVADGRLEVVPLPGTNKVYLRRNQIEEIEAEDARRRS